jgi:hypothetical protein
MSMATTCLYKNQEITVNKALEKRDEARAHGQAAGLEFRCIECREPVVPHSMSGVGGAHFEHKHRNPKCDLSRH